MTADPSPLDTAILFRRAIARLNRRLRTQTREAELTVAKHGILGHLYRDGATTPGALAIAEGVQPQSLTRVLADLEESGHVLRQQDAEDRRQFKLEITQEGREILERDAAKRAMWLADAMTSCLSRTEQEMLRLAGQLMERLAELPADADLDAGAAAQEEEAGLLR